MTSASKKLLKIRKEHGYSQTELAEILGVSQPQISNYEMGKVEPSRTIKRKIDSLLAKRLEGETGVGEWLREQRSKNRLTQDELARKAGVSKIAISYIETGRTESPQRSTIEALEKALGKLPHRVRTEITEEEQVGGLGQFRGPFPRDGWESNVEESVSGIYVLYDSLLRPVRIGQAENIKTRLMQYQRESWYFKDPTVESFAYITVKDEKFRKQLEDVLIKFMGKNAIFNIRGAI